MEELYVEGVATRDGPEPCVDDPRGRGEALDRGTCRPGYRAAKWESGVPTLYKRRKATPSVALSRVAGGPRAVKRTRACTEPSCARTGRARVRPAV